MKTKILTTILATISVIFMLWVAISWGEIALKNTTEKPTYSQANLFMLIAKA